MALSDTKQFHQADFPGTLFPLETNRILIQEGAQALDTYIYEEIASDTPNASFLVQERVYGCKHDLHLRRTHKLDPIAEYFLYDLIYRNRAAFKAPPPGPRRSYGYHFASGELASASDSYRSYKSAIHKAGSDYRFVLKFDVANYFNSLYHHDLSHWFENLAENADSALFGKFLRQINGGRSIDCLTQGISPTKIIGSRFLRFVESDRRLQSPVVLRFMDDVCLFANREDTLRNDFILIQKLLGDRGLSVNPAKTFFGEAKPELVVDGVDHVRAELLKRKRKIYRSSDHLDFEYKEALLTEEEDRYLMALLKSKNLEEDDAELILAVMREHGNDLLDFLANILPTFPYLARNIAIFCDHVTDETELLQILTKFISKNATITEYQLFWVTRIVENKLLNEGGVADLLQALFAHPGATKITKAKVLEIADERHGLADLRAEQLRTGSSDWLTWSSIVGVRATRRTARNHLLGYVANSSPINRLIATTIKAL
jgi:hypothetical protein